jgi:hypothetical protein
MRYSPHGLETTAQALISFLKSQSGTLHLCLEEGTQSTSLVEVLTPRVAKIVVLHVSESQT